MVEELKIPKALPLDWFSRNDELMLLQIDFLKALAQKMGVTVIGGQGGGGGVVQITPGGIDLSEGGYDVLPAQQIFNQNGCREASTAFYPQEMADISQADNVLIIVQSSLDQDVTAQAIGALSKQADSINTFNIESSQALSAGSLIGIGIDMNSLWYPFIGVSITTSASAPASGHVNAWVYSRRRR